MSMNRPVISALGFVNINKGMVKSVSTKTTGLLLVQIFLRLNNILLQERT